jgi:uncharacterized protein YkwD
MWAAPTDTTKTFLSSLSFAHLWVILESEVPTVLFAWEGITIKGRVTTPVTHVIIYALVEGGEPVSMLTKVGSDKKFHADIPLPRQAGDMILVVAAGNSFDTDIYPTMTLIESGSLTYPSLASLRYWLIPRLSLMPSVPPSIRLPGRITGELTMTQGNITHTTAGNTLILKDIPLSPGKVSVSIRGYRTSTASSLDRSADLGVIYSGSVILDRSHEIIGREKVIVQVQWSNANFRFNTPRDIRIRPQYYITSPSGDVTEYVFARSLQSSDGYLKPGITLKGSLPLLEEWIYLLEIVREDGVAHANTTLARWAVWPVLTAIPEVQVRSIRTDTTLIRRENLSRLNTLRTRLGRTRLIVDPTLTTLAQAKVDDMIARDYQWHADPEGRYIDTLAEKLSLHIDSTIGENIGYGTVSDISLQDGLEESWVHKYNMLQPNWRKIGIGYGIKDGKVHLVQVFGE